MTDIDKVLLHLYNYYLDKAGKISSYLVNHPDHVYYEVLRGKLLAYQAVLKDILKILNV